MKFKVNNMTSNHCKMRIEQALKGIKVKKINFDMESQIVTVALKKQTVEDVKTAVNAIGYNFDLIEA